MIMSPIREAVDDELIDREQLKAFLEKYEKQIKAEDWPAVIKDLENNGYGRDNYKLVKAIFSEILGENILTKMETIPARFFVDDNIKTVSIPGNITSIGDGAFKNCKELEVIDIPDSVTAIGEEAFSGCAGLKNIRLSDKLEVIPNKAFAGCSALENVFIPDSVKRMGYDVFANCPDTMVVELNRGVNRAEGPNDPHPTAVKMKTSTHDFVSKHLKWKNA